MLMFSFKTRSEIIADLRTALRNPTSITANERRWSDSELEFALNMTLYFWGGSVSMPATYAVTSADDVELPWYIHSIEQVLRTDDNKPLATFREVQRWDHLLFTPPNTEEDCTIIFPLLNRACSVDGASITIDTEFDPSQSTLVLSTTAPYVPETGILKIDDIWFAYVRDAVGASTVTVEVLKALTRGRTLPATMAAATGVETGVFVPDPVLWAHMEYYASSILHNMFHSDGSVSDIENHQWFMRWNDAAAEASMKRYQPRVPRQRLLKK